MDTPQYDRSRELLDELHRLGLFGEGKALAESTWHGHPLDRPGPGERHKRFSWELELTPAADADPEQLRQAQEAIRAFDWGEHRPPRVTIGAPRKAPTKVINP